MNKKKYIMPRLRVAEISGADLICTSMRLYDEEASFAGARGRGDSYEDIDDD